MDRKRKEVGGSTERRRDFLRDSPFDSDSKIEVVDYNSTKKNIH